MDTNSISVKNKYANKNLPTISANNASSKKIYKCSEMSTIQHGKVFAYGLYSTQGSVRPYNEDRVVEYHTVLKPEAGVEVNFSFFGIYDGHGGQQWSKYLWEELHKNLAEDPSLFRNPMISIKRHISDIDSKFLSQISEDGHSNIDLQRAGSWLNIVVIIDEMCYVANVGDSRSIMSSQGGKILYQLSRDHKPSDPIERDRVIDAGGKIYVSAIKQNNSSSGYTLQRTDKLITKNDDSIGATENAISVIENGGEAYGPHRVIPGRLSVSRAIGDAHAKLRQLGGNPNVVISRPDIK